VIGAIAGDIIGSVWEWDTIKTTEFPLFAERSAFTDDTVLTVAVADCILSGRGYVEAFHDWYDRYPDSGYGGMFIEWARWRRTDPYDSWGNGSAMRVSPVGFAFDTLEEVLAEAERSAAVTHDHPEGIKGAQATAAAIFLAREGRSKDEIRDFVQETFRYDLERFLDEIRPLYKFDVSCQGSVPESILAFLESEDWEGAVRNAVSLGGDTDTMACITGGIAQAFYGGLPDPIRRRALEMLEPDLRDVTEAFCGSYGC